MSDTTGIDYFICGGFGGVCTVLVGHPFDTLKVRLQTMPVPKPGEPPLYTGMMDCLRKTIVREGVTGLYKGMGAPLLAITPIFAISFMGFKLTKQMLGPDETKFTYLDYFIAGGVAGFLTTIVMAPGERIKCLLQIQQDAASKKYAGPFNAAKLLYKEGGIRSIFKGSGATLIRDIPASGVYYLTYEAIKNYLTDRGRKDISLHGTLFAGGCSGVSHWLIGMPADVLKSRLQTAPEGTYPNGTRDVFTDLMRKEGPLALYKGIAPVLLRSFPANAACFLGFELCNKMLTRIKENFK